MNPQELQQLLATCRPGTSDARDPDVARALEAIKADPELRRWLEQHAELHSAFHEKFNEIPVPADLRNRILTGSAAPVPFPWPRFVPWLAAAAALLLFLGVWAVWLAPREPQGFPDFRARMVRTVLREYRMDIFTSDMVQVRRYLASREAPADYVLPPNLETVPVAGGGRLTWLDQPVSMVCFDRGAGDLLYLFVIDQAALPNPPQGEFRFAPVNKLTTVSWTTGNKVYLLAAELPESSLRNYL